MNKEELINKLRSCRHTEDTETAHIKADEFLLEYINDPDIAKAFDDVPKWYS